MPQFLTYDQLAYRYPSLFSPHSPIRVIYIRGLPGVGKTTLARRWFPDWHLLEADQFMVDANGEYHWQPSRARQSHDDCLAALRTLLQTTSTPIIIANTFTQRWELHAYLFGSVIHPHPRPRWRKGTTYVPPKGPSSLVLCLSAGSLTDINLAQRNIHGVSSNVIRAMRRCWQSFQGEISLEALLLDNQ